MVKVATIRENIKDYVRERMFIGIGSLVGRLDYCAELCDFDTGRYEHSGIEGTLGIGKDGFRQVGPALGELHLEIFEDWLDLSLEEKLKDLEVFLAEIEGSRDRTVAVWSSLHSYSRMLPAMVSPPERDHFEMDFNTILEMASKRKSRGVSG